MAESVTIVSLPQMADLSLNCQDGVINFQTLRTLLHVVIQQANLTDVAVEFRGPDSERVQALIASTKPGSFHNLPKYSISADPPKTKLTKKGTPKKKTSLHDVVKEKERQNVEEAKEKELRVIDRRKDSKEDPDLHPPPLKSPPGSMLGVTPGDLQTVVVVESHSPLPQYTVALSKETFDNLQTDLNQMKEQIKELTELPGNLGLLESTRTSGPILDMFNIINLTKRMEANETALDKVGSLLEDLARQEFTPGDRQSDAFDRIEEVRQSVDVRRRSTISNVEARLNQLEKTVTDLQANMGPGGASKGFETIHEEKPSDLEDESSTHRAQKGSIDTHESGSVTKPPAGSKEDATIKVWSPQGPFTSVLQDVDLGDLPPNQALILIQQELQNMKTWMGDSIQEIDRRKAFGSTPATEINTQAIDSKFSECEKKIQELNELYANQIGMLNEQFQNVQSEMSDVATKLEVILPGGDSTGINAETTLELANKFDLLEKEMMAMVERAAELQVEREQRDKQIEALMEQIDILKIVKANREDLEDALGDKADACQINRKVSHDQFDAACDDLSRGIEEALTKLEEQESMWQQALQAIQREVGNKLDKMEVDPLRDFVNSKLRALQEKFRSLTQLRREQEAAGTKSKFLRNVNCISCDKDVVMRKEMDPSLKPKPFAMPPSRNMAPYLAYELDQLRKQQKCVPHSKNLNFIEGALKTRANKQKDHVCNRYCGGSHTVTTPQQRVTRLGHFLEQWGPEIAPLHDEYIRGNDNHMYKARDENLQRKIAGKQENQGREGSSQPVGDHVVTTDATPQQDRDTYVSPEAQQKIDAQEEQNSIQQHRMQDKKFNNIGSTGLDENTIPRTSSISKEKSPSQIQMRGSQTQRLSQTEPRGSQTQRPSATEPRGSQTQRPSTTEPRGSQSRNSGPTTEPRGSQPRASTEIRGSQTQVIENRASQTFSGEHEQQE